MTFLYLYVLESSENVKDHLKFIQLMHLQHLRHTKGAPVKLLQMREMSYDLCLSIRLGGIKTGHIMWHAFDQSAW